MAPPHILFTGHALPEFMAGMRSRGYEVTSGAQYEWYPRAHLNLTAPPSNIPGMLPDEYGAFLERTCREREVSVLVLYKPFDSNLCRRHGKMWSDHACGGASEPSPNFWHLPAEYVRRIRESGVVIVWISIDDPNDFGFGTNTGLYPLLDVVGTCATDAIEWYRRFAPQADVYRFWPAFDRMEFHDYGHAERPATPVECDFALVGGTYFAPGAPGNKPNPGFGLLRRDVIRAAVDAGAKVHVYGSDDWVRSDRGGSEDFAPLYRGFAPRHTLARVFAGVRIGYSSFVRKAWHYLTDRIPIVAGGGAFNLLEAQMGLNETFRHNVHCAYHTPGSARDVTRMVEWWLDHEDDRAVAADAMRELVLAEHNYDVRAAELDGHLRSAIARRASEPRASCCK